MPTSFRKSFDVIQRDIGQVVNGKYYPSTIGTVTTIQATVQMPSTGDMMAIDATPYGKRASRYLKIYTDTRLHCVNQEIAPGRGRYAGDLFLFDGSKYLLFGEADFQMLSRSRTTRVSHWRYYACEMIEGSDLEHGP